MKDAKVVTVTNEEPESLWQFLNKSLPLPYEQFLLMHFKHPKFRKEMFFLLKSGDKIISMFSNRDTSIFNRDLNVALFGGVATDSEYRKQGCMKFLVREMLKKLQEEKDFIINPWTAKRNYKRVYAKLGFSRIKKLKTTYEFYKNLSHEKGFSKSKIRNFHKFRMRDRNAKPRRQIFFTLIFYLQYLYLSRIHLLQKSPKSCKVEKSEKLKDKEVEKLNELFTEYCSKRAVNFFERDEEIWRFIHRYYDIYLIKDNGENVGYAVGSLLKDCLVIYEIFAKDSGTYFYAVSYFEELAREEGMNEITVWADTLHRSLAKYGYIPNNIVFRVPFDPRGVSVIVRPLKNFFERIKITEDCRLCLDDPLLSPNSSVKIGEGDFSVSVHLTQKEIADLIFGGSVVRTLFKAEVRPKHKICTAYKILSKIKKEYEIKDCLRTQFDKY